MALVTLVEYKAFYNITVADDDVSNQGLINAAEAFITQFCGRPLSLQSYTELHDGGHSTLFLGATPVVSITSLKILGVAYTDYSLYKDAGIIKAGNTVHQAYTGNGRTFSGNIQEIEVVYNAGLATIPEDLKYCVYILAKKIANDKTGKATSNVKRQRLHNEDREFFQSSLKADRTASAFLGNEIVAILNQYI